MRRLTRGGSESSRQGRANLASDGFEGLDRDAVQQAAHLCAMEGVRRLNRHATKAHRSVDWRLLGICSVTCFLTASSCESALPGTQAFLVLARGVTGPARPGSGRLQQRQQASVSEHIQAAWTAQSGHVQARLLRQTRERARLAAGRNGGQGALEVGRRLSKDTAVSQVLRRTAIL